METERVLSCEKKTDLIINIRNRTVHSPHLTKKILFGLCCQPIIHLLLKIKIKFKKKKSQVINQRLGHKIQINEIN